MAAKGAKQAWLGRLACAALLVAGAFAPARAMDFRLETVRGARGPQVIVAEGQITNSTPSEFLSFLRENATGHDMRTIVLLNSQGGYVVASMELGHIFRRMGAMTMVAQSAGDGRFAPASCLSACVYAFMGGRRRVAPPGSALGIHRMFANQSEGGLFDTKVYRIHDNGSMARLLIGYSSRMGVSGDLIRTAEHVSSSSIHLVTPGEMTRWRLAGRAF